MSGLLMEGWVHKRGNRIKTWRKRWLEVYPGAIRYYTAKGGALKGEFGLVGACVREATEAEAKQLRRPHVLVLDTPSRAFLIDTTSATQRPMWKRSLEKASGSADEAAAGAAANSHSSDDEDSSDSDTAAVRLRSASEQPATLQLLKASSKRSDRSQSVASELSAAAAAAAAAGGGTGSPGGSRLSAAVHAAGQLPDVMDIDGPPETGSELRVRSDGNKLDSLCCAWFRIRPASGGWELSFPLERGDANDHGHTAGVANAAPGDMNDEAVLAAIAGMGVDGLRAAFEGEATGEASRGPSASTTGGSGLASNPAAFLAPGRRTADPHSCLLRLELIPNATRQTYTPTSTDVDCLIGCFAQPASGGGAHCVVTDRPVALVSDDEVAVRIRLQPHTHHKFCDRRRRVCTAVGRYREGEVLLATLRGELQRTHKLIWERSERFPHVYPRVGLPGGGDVAAAEAGEVQDEHREVAAPSSAPVSLPSSALEGVCFERAPVRPVAHLPPTPAAHEPSPAFASLLKGRRSKRSSSRVGREAAGIVGRYPLFRADVGRMIRCRLVPVADSDGEDGEEEQLAEAVSLPVGPIEPAPPRVRECWIDGVPAVGRLLVGRHWYYGGFEGLTTAEWVRVDEEGETTTVKGPTAIPPGVPLPVPTADVEATPDVLIHPCVYQLSEEDVGCVFKFKAQPARSDSDSGHVATSRPTREVQAESQREWVPPVVEPGSFIDEAGVY